MRIAEVSILLHWFLGIGAILPSDFKVSGLEICEQAGLNLDSKFTNKPGKSVSYNTGHEVSHLDRRLPDECG